MNWLAYNYAHDVVLPGTPPSTRQGSAVVPSSSMSSQGRAKVMRYLSIGVARAARTACW